MRLSEIGIEPKDSVRRQHRIGIATTAPVWLWQINLDGKPVSIELLDCWGRLARWSYTGEAVARIRRKIETCQRVDDVALDVPGASIVSHTTAEAIALITPPDDGNE